MHWQLYLFYTNSMHYQRLIPETDYLNNSKYIQGVEIWSNVHINFNDVVCAGCR